MAAVSFGGGSAAASSSSSSPCSRRRRNSVGGKLGVGATLSLASAWVAALQAPSAALASAPFHELEAQAFASLAQAAYCGKTEAYAESLSRWDCGPCVDSGLDVVPGSVRVMETDDGHQDNATVTFVARAAPNSKLGDACIVSVRGTTNVANWVRNFQVWKEDVAFGDCEACRVEFGFATIWEEVRPRILGALEEVGCVPSRPAAASPGAPAVSAAAAAGTTSAVYVTGHSMGAAVGTLAMLTLHKLGYEVLPSYLFESPRLGNQAFADAFETVFNDQTRPVWRITHAKDPVPDLPPSMLGYRHVPYQIHYFPNGTLRRCDYPFDPMCAPGLVSGLHHIADHCQLPLTPAGTICGCYNASRTREQLREVVMV